MIYLAADHRGYKLKEKIKQWLTEWGFEYEDCGAFEYNESDDYPDFVRKVAQAVANDPEQSRGIVLGMSGQGEAMAANRFKGVRAAVFYGPSLIRLGSGFLFFMFNRSIFGKLIRLTREHNDANVLTLGASFLDRILAKKAIKLWLETPFSQEERHKRRVEKIEKL